MPTERPSPFTIPAPTYRFVNGTPTQPPPREPWPVGFLIHKLTAFADFYEKTSAEIERAEPLHKRYATGTRDANVDNMQRAFRATADIERVRAYVLAQYGADLTIETARRLLGGLIRCGGLSVEAAEALTLGEAMDRLEATDNPIGKRPRPTSNVPVELMNVYTNGLAEERFDQIKLVLNNINLTANEKLYKIDELISIPMSASAQTLGAMLGVTSAAVQKTGWWEQYRKGEKRSEVGRRTEGHKEKAKVLPLIGANCRGFEPVPRLCSCLP